MSNYTISSVIWTIPKRETSRGSKTLVVLIHRIGWKWVVFISSFTRTFLYKVIPCSPSVERMLIKASHLANTLPVSHHNILRSHMCPHFYRTQSWPSHSVQIASRATTLNKIKSLADEFLERNLLIRVWSEYWRHLLFNAFHLRIPDFCDVTPCL
jgi:hypothetical protein